MSQSRLDRPDERDTVECTKMCHCHEDVDETELNSCSHALDGPAFLHFHGQHRECELWVVAVQQKEPYKDGTEAVLHGGGESKQQFL